MNEISKYGCSVINDFFQKLNQREGNFLNEKWFSPTK